MNMRMEKKFQGFVEFLRKFIQEINDLSREGSVILVEGKRDVKALADVGYIGSIVSIAALNGKGWALLENAKLVIIMTDFDREGRQLAVRYTKLLSYKGVETSLVYRKRLRIASRGLFLHVENLARFANHTSNFLDVTIQEFK
jgi:5S rRNA maturation endonuclease (ribonuclease M5)